jgi:hypothetical protein
MSSVEIVQALDDARKLTARFAVPDARQQDIVDRIGRRFWEYIEDYSDSSIGFSSERRTKRCRQQPPRRSVA